MFDPSVIPAVFDIMEGASQLINLTARANPVNCTYSLMRNGVPLSLPWDVSSLTLELGVLTVSGISRDDGGLYTVMAINTEGSTKYNFSINVQCELFFSFVNYIFVVQLWNHQKDNIFHVIVCQSMSYFKPNSRTLDK